MATLWKCDNCGIMLDAEPDTWLKGDVGVFSYAASFGRQPTEKEAADINERDIHGALRGLKDVLGFSQETIDHAARKVTADLCQPCMKALLAQIVREAAYA